MTQNDTGSFGHRCMNHYSPQSSVRHCFSIMELFTNAFPVQIAGCQQQQRLQVPMGRINPSLNRDRLLLPWLSASALTCYPLVASSTSEALPNFQARSPSMEPCRSTALTVSMRGSETPH
jgi:hypothetical protein